MDNKNYPVVIQSTLLEYTAALAQSFKNGVPLTNEQFQYIQLLKKAAA